MSGPESFDTLGTGFAKRARGHAVWREILSPGWPG